MPLIPPKTWRIPKDGNRPGECEDAFRVVFPSGGPAIMRAAVSDGASEAAFSRQWAQILADAFVDRPLELQGLTEECLLGWLRRCQDNWHAAVPWDRIPWHGEAKARAGSFATLLGLSLSAADEPGPSVGRPSLSEIAVSSWSAMTGCQCRFPWMTRPGSTTTPGWFAAIRSIWDPSGTGLAGRAGSVSPATVSSSLPMLCRHGSWRATLPGRPPGRPWKN